MIEFQYFEGCPNSAKSLANLKELIEDNIIADKEIKITEVPDLEVSERVKFQGSPTILYNGMDIYTGMIPDISSYTCRMYEINGERTGILTKVFIKEKISELSH